MNKQRCYAKISLDNLIHNFKVISSVCPASRIMPVIKADAYAHGAMKVAHTLEKMTDIFAVAEIEEAIQLRLSGVRADILILGYTSPERADELVHHGFIQTVMSLDYAKDLEKHISQGKLPIHIKIDTGMRRLGFDFANPNTVSEIEKISSMSCFSLEGMFTHFTESDMLDSGFTDLQEKRFEEVISSLREKSINPKYLHSANSAALLTRNTPLMNMVRPGLVLYGAYPSEQVKNRHLENHPDLPLREVMTLCARVAQIHTVKKGEGIGYNRTYTASRDTVVATVSAGYADGIPRSLSNKGEVTVNSHRFPIVGNVCMDLLMIDITGFEDKVSVGDEVQFWGSASIGIDEYAKLSGMINYTLYTGVSKRVEMVYEDTVSDICPSDK